MLYSREHVSSTYFPARGLLQESDFATDLAAVVVDGDIPLIRYQVRVSVVSMQSENGE